ncbi:MAG: hypothetical protein ACT4QE_12245 [Anaerolineales bacterium]
MDTIHEIYESQVKPLSVQQRLELMRLIMDDLARSTPRWAVQTSDAWSPEDEQDLRRAALGYASIVSFEGEGDAEAG